MPKSSISHFLGTVSNCYLPSSQLNFSICLIIRFKFSPKSFGKNIQWSKAFLNQPVRQIWSIRIFIVTITAYMRSHPHLLGDTRISELSSTFSINHPQSPAFCLMETKLPRQIVLQEEKRNICHRFIRISSRELCVGNNAQITFPTFSHLTQ